MGKFTFEELCLMRIFETTEPELLGLFGSILEKLEALTDEEYTALAIYLDVEDFYAEDEGE
jgi:hypothetical protein